jgi:hypothetical protein
MLLKSEIMKLNNIYKHNSTSCSYSTIHYVSEIFIFRDHFLIVREHGPKRNILPMGNGDTQSEISPKVSV